MVALSHPILAMAALYLAALCAIDCVRIVCRAPEPRRFTQPDDLPRDREPNGSGNVVSFKHYKGTR